MMLDKKMAVVAICLLLISGICGCIGGNESPTVTVSANPKSGYQPLEVIFNVNATDSDGSIQSYYWDFKDGTTSNKSNPSHTFDYGTYTVTVTVTDNEGAKTSKSITITVNNHSPTASVSANPASGNAPLTVTFSMSASDSDGSISSWNLDVNNDGTAEYSGSGSPPSTKIHNYQNSGTYTAKLTVTDNEEASASDTVTIYVIEPPPEPITLQGTGDTATTTFTLEEGIAIFHMTHDGSSNFAIWLYNAETGERVELLVNEISPYDGSTIVGVTGKIGQASPSRHLLDVTADGNWEVTIEQPRPTTAPNIPQTFTGKGDGVSSPFMLETGTVIFEMVHDGNSNFAIWLYDSDGNRVDLLVNEIGPYDGSTIVGVTGKIGQASPGIHCLDITADGNWEVTITQL